MGTVGRGDYRNYYKGHMDKTKGEGGGSGEEKWNQLYLNINKNKIKVGLKNNIVINLYGARWALRLFPALGYCELCCYEHWFAQVLLNWCFRVLRV